MLYSSDILHNFFANRICILYSLGLTGINLIDLKQKTIEDFKCNDEKQEKIKFEFYNQQRNILLKELVLARKKVIRLKLADAKFHQEEEEKHLQKILEKEDEKFQKVLVRQDRETKRLVNEQLGKINYIFELCECSDTIKITENYHDFYYR